MEPPLDFQQFLGLLLTATQRGELDWQPTVGKAEDSFQADLTGGRVRLTKTVYRTTYLLQLLDTQDTLIREYEPIDERDKYAATQLFYNVRIKALRLGQTEQMLIRDLKKRANQPV
jgi:hypothetical protein